MPFESLLGAGVSLAGSLLGGRQQRRGAERAIAAGTNFNTNSLFGNANFQGGQLMLQPGGQFPTLSLAGQNTVFNALGNLNNLDFQAREQAEFDRLQQLRQPGIEAARADLREQQFNRGRLGFARGGGLGGQLFNPQSAALEEAILRAQLGDVGAARELSQGQQQFLLDQALGGLQIPTSINQTLQNQARLGIGARTPQALAGLNQATANTQARTTEGFFGALGNTLGGLFGGGGGGSRDFIGLRSTGISRV